jgi:hypothetical protein
VRVGFDVPDVGGAPAELGHEPERVALQAVPDRRLARLPAPPPARLEDRPAADEAAADECLDERVQHAALEAFDQAGFRPHADYSMSVKPLRIGVLAVQGNFRVANWRERRLTEEALERFGLPVAEVVIDRDGRVLSVSAD